MTVAALYVDPAGVYAGLPGVEVWDEARDARTYSGPWAVVAHPPCARWSILGSCRGYRDGDDDGCFAAALATVQRFGGVLEHPCYSLAWERFALPKPTTGGWTQSLLDDGYATEIDQRLYGHVANKRTWLYYCGGGEPPAMRWGRGARDRKSVRHLRGGAGEGQRSWTPPAFRDALLAMARSAQPSLAILPPLGAAEFESREGFAGQKPDQALRLFPADSHKVGAVSVARRQSKEHAAPEALASEPRDVLCPSPSV